VIFGLLVIDECELVIPPGTDVFVHGGLARQDELIFNDGGLLFQPGGRLSVQGTVDAPVTFQGDRLESEFEDLSGQWAGIRFLPGSQGHALSHTILKNSQVGIRVDSAAAVTLDAVQIFNTSNIGLLGLHAEIEASNCLIHSNGPQSVVLASGGDYNFTYCTIGNYFNQSTAIYLDNFTCLDPECSIISINTLNASFTNSIIMGSNDDEVDLQDATDGAEPDQYNVFFDHTLLRITAEFDLPEGSCINCIRHLDEPVFLNENQDDYSLDTSSIAIRQGRHIPSISQDILGILRNLEQPDLGCFEFIE